MNKLTLVKTISHRIFYHTKYDTAKGVCHRRVGHGRNEPELIRIDGVSWPIQFFKEVLEDLEKNYGA